MGDMRKLAAAVVLSAATVTAQGPADVRTLAKQSLAQIDGEIDVDGLKAPVTVVRDRWGVPHITARSTDDLFFAQGYVMAQDRLWQMEMWRRARRRTAGGDSSGRGAVARDRVARLLKYRGPFDDTEWTSYHPEGKRIFTAFVERRQRVHRAQRETACRSSSWRRASRRSRGRSRQSCCGRRPSATRSQRAAARAQRGAARRRTKRTGPRIPIRATS